MKKINWKVRAKNKSFWLAAIPAVLLVTQQVLAVFGVTVDVAGVQSALLNIVSAVFSVLALLGVVVDPTTQGVCDSSQALEYEVPKVDEEDTDEVLDEGGDLNA